MELREQRGQEASLMGGEVWRCLVEWGAVFKIWALLEGQRCGQVKCRQGLASVRAERWGLIGNAEGEAPRYFICFISKTAPGA